MVESPVDARQPPLPPETAVSYAWALTLTLSTCETVRERGIEVTDNMKARRAELEKSFREEKYKKEREYLDAFYAAIDSTFRTLTSIHNGREKNFKEVDDMMRTFEGKVKALDELSLTAQSAIPRASTAIVGGTASIPVMAWFLNLNPILIALLAPFFAGISYLVYEYPYSMFKRRLILKLMVETDYRRNLYYRQYVQRSRRALVSLFRSVLGIYKNVYDTDYKEDAYNDPKKVNGAVNLAMSAEGLLNDKDLHPWCKYIIQHKAEGKVKWDVWAMCDSGEGVETCPYFPKPR